MKKIRAAVVGYGNIGHFALEALEAASDFEIAGVVRRQGDKDKPLALTPYTVVDDIRKLKDVDVAILATPTRNAGPCAQGLELYQLWTRHVDGPFGSCAQQERG